ncbi:hypothetical protein GYH30_016024 [Glycine max]|nr:hypothetical protein GYH30_016024 [Glycine max]
MATSSNTGQKLKEWPQPAFFNYELLVVVAVASQGDQLGDNDRAILQGTCVEDQLVCSDQREVADVVSTTITGGDLKELGDVANGVLEKQGDLAEPDSGVKGEDALHEGVVMEIEGQGEGLVEDVFCFVNETARRGRC